MKVKSVSGITLSVTDVNRSAQFYETLGFTIRTREADHATAYSNWFWIDLVASGGAGEGRQHQKGAV